MNPVNSKHYVSHPIFPSEKLDGKKIALPHGKGFHFECTLAVDGPKREDGKYVLLITRLMLVPPQGKKDGLMDLHVESLDQATVDRIEAAKSGSYAHLGGAEFVVFPTGE
jgi:hypothetical protein